MLNIFKTNLVLAQQDPTMSPSFNPFASEFQRDQEAERREKLKFLLENKEYEGFATYELESWEAQEPVDEDEPEKVLNIMKETEDYPQVLTQIFPFMEQFFQGMAVADKVRALSFLIEEDQVELLERFLTKLELPKENYMDLLELSVAFLALDCMDFLFSLEHDWSLTPAIYYGWVTQNLGVPKGDACARRIAMHFLSKEGKNKLRPEDATPYPMNRPVEILKGMSDGMSDQSFFADYMSFFLCTPLMKHWIEHDLVETRELNKIPQILQNHVHHLLLADYRLLLEENNQPKLHFYWSAGEGAFNTIYDSYHFLQPVSTYEQLANITECLVEHHPNMLKRDKVRAVIASMALVDRPTEAMLKRAEKLTGKRLIIQDFHLPWVEKGPFQTEELIQNDFLDHWEERMPKKLKLAFKHNDYLSGISVVPWLEHCEVVGEPKGDRLSALAEAVAGLPCDSPCFLEALKEGGIIYQQREKYWEWINERKNHLRSHYLASIIHLKERKIYEL